MDKEHNQKGSIKKQKKDRRGSTSPSKDLLVALTVIEKGIEAADFILNYGRGTKSRVLGLWLRKAKAFIAANAALTGDCHGKGITT
jgi:hypothetical protein